MEGIKKYGLVGAFLLIAFVSWGQRIRYKDLFPTMDEMSNSELKNALKEYIADDPEHPNAVFRLALVYETSYKRSDVLTDYNYAMANAEQAKLRFLKAKMLVDEREVNHNNEYYFPIFKTFDSKGKPNVEFPLVAKKIQDGYDSAILFSTKAPAIYADFTRSVNSYDKAVKNFAHINNEFVSLDDLYMYFDADVEKQLGELKMNYDSAKFYFDRYIGLIGAYPIPNHKQKYTVKPIITYRLDGLLTRMNFLTNNVEFWNYGAWVDQIRKSVTAEIGSLRTKLQQNEDKLDESLTKIDGSSGEGITPVKLDKQLVFTLNNYDKQSLALSLLDYKAFKQNWMIQSKTLHLDTVNSDRNADIYSTLIYSNRGADTLITEVKARLTPEKIRKHNDFLLKYYGNKEGLTRYTSAEEAFIKKTFDDYSAKLRTELLYLSLEKKPAATPDKPSALGTPKPPEAAKFLKFGKWNVFVTASPATPELIEKGDPITAQAKKSPDGAIYLSGVYRPDKKANNTVTFIAKIGPDGKPAWMKGFDFKLDTMSATPDSHSYPGPLELTKEGCVFVVHSTGISQAGQQNTFVYLNDKGDGKFKIKLKESSYPRLLNYSEKSNSFILVLKGQSEKSVYTLSEPVTGLSINVLGDVLWTRSFELTGNITALVNVVDGYILAGNYMVIKDNAGKEFRTKANASESSPYVMKVNERGELIKINPIQTSKPIFVSNVVKVNDNSINLVGWEGTFDAGVNRSMSSGDPIVYIMTNRFCQVICSAL